jgi:hypothetical protein
LSDADSSLVHVYGQPHTKEAMSDRRQMVENGGSTRASAKFDTLPPDTDEVTRQRIAEQLAPEIARHFTDYPWLTSPGEWLSKSEEVAQQMFVDAVAELYNPAQLDVLQRASAAAYKKFGREARADQTS